MRQRHCGEGEHVHTTSVVEGWRWHWQPVARETETRPVRGFPQNTTAGRNEGASSTQHDPLGLWRWSHCDAAETSLIRYTTQLLADPMAVLARAWSLFWKSISSPTLPRRTPRTPSLCIRGCGHALRANTQSILRLHPSPYQHRPKSTLIFRTVSKLRVHAGKQHCRLKEPTGRHFSPRVHFTWFILENSCDVTG